MTDSDFLIREAETLERYSAVHGMATPNPNAERLRRVAKALPLLVAVATILDKDVPEYYRNRPWETAPCEVGAGLFKKAHEALAALKGDAP